MSSLPPWLRGSRLPTVVAAVAGLVAVGVVIGLLVAWLSTHVLQAAGLDTDATSAPSATPGGGPSTGPTGHGGPAPGPSQHTTRNPQSPSSPPLGRPSLTASPRSVGTYDDIHLSGRFPGLPDGTALQLERKESGTWSLFPVSLSIDQGGSFSTYVQTGRTGQNLFRVTDPNSGISTPVVAISVS